MELNFEFTAPQRVIFGPGALREVGALAAGFGRRALVVTGRDAGRAAPLLALLREHGVEATVFPVAGEPTTDLVDQGAVQAVRIAADLVVACGGGSPLDAAKAIAALATNGGQPLDYMEVVGRGQPLVKPSLPLIAIPTTAGTGSEATRNAVLTSPEHGVKASMRSVSMVPRVALVDPELTYGLPPAVTASTGLDALTQLIEPFTCNRTNPLVDALCRDGIARVARSLRRAWANGRDAAAREDMALASLFGGLALANSGLGVVHGLAAPLGGALHAPHGALCAAILPHAAQVNLAALQARDPESPVLDRFQEAARLLTGRIDASAQDGVRWLQDLVCDLEIPGLASLGLESEALAGIVLKAREASSFKANPVVLQDVEILEILQRAL